MAYASYLGREPLASVTSSAAHDPTLAAPHHGLAHADTTMRDAARHPALCIAVLRLSNPAKHVWITRAAWHHEGGSTARLFGGWAADPGALGRAAARLCQLSADQSNRATSCPGPRNVSKTQRFLVAGLQIKEHLAVRGRFYDISDMKRHHVIVGADASPGGGATCIHSACRPHSDTTVSSHSRSHGRINLFAPFGEVWQQCCPHVERQMSRRCTCGAPAAAVGCAHRRLPISASAV